MRGIDLCRGCPKPVFIAAKSVRNSRRIPFTGAHQIGRLCFPTHSGRKFHLSWHDLFDLAVLRGFSGNLRDSTSAWFDRRGFVSCELEQTRRFFSETASQSRLARSDRTFRRCHLLAFEHACVPGNANPTRCRMHVFRNADVWADNSVLLLPSNVTGCTEGGWL